MNFSDEHNELVKDILSLLSKRDGNECVLILVNTLLYVISEFPEPQKMADWCGQAIPKRIKEYLDENT